MDRDAWLRERREVAERRFDTLHASGYDEHWGTISPSHRRFVADLVERCPPGGRILDAACGTGKYFPMILEAGRQVAGTDQSAGMLAQARRKHPEVPTERVGLQDLAYDGAFDAAICVDAMENVGPEDWPTVLANLRRAVRPGGYVYLTVELPEDGQLARAFDAARARGAPVVWGEDAAEHGGYHFYPSRDQVAAWLDAAGLPVVREGAGDDYLHLVLQRDGA
jgi:ubiquinone/menaquinone biosynthesis C-methylase UbiE